VVQKGHKNKRRQTNKSLNMKENENKCGNDKNWIREERYEMGYKVDKAEVKVRKTETEHNKKEKTTC
jgi:hypothetical protein